MERWRWPKGIFCLRHPHVTKQAELLQAMGPMMVALVAGVWARAGHLGCTWFISIYLFLLGCTRGWGFGPHTFECQISSWYGISSNGKSKGSYECFNLISCSMSRGISVDSQMDLGSFNLPLVV
jgi:hypothetical protein